MDSLSNHFNKSADVSDEAGELNAIMTDRNYGPKSDSLL